MVVEGAGGKGLAAQAIEARMVAFGLAQEELDTEGAVRGLRRG